MTFADSIRQYRDWFPVPQSNGQINLVRWILLEGNRNAIASALLTFVFVSLMGIGTLWTFEMADILTETRAVETILNTFLSGMILLVSIVVSINSIVLSHDITSVGTQKNRIQSVVDFRQNIGDLTEGRESPTDPAAFLTLMSNLIGERAKRLEESADDTSEELANELQQYSEALTKTLDPIDDNLTESVSGAEFGVLWLGLELDYGHFVDQSRTFRASYQDSLSDDVEAQLEDLIEAFQLFATGKEYFKTLYYSQEISELSRTLLVISLPAILLNASAILAINAGVLPNFWILGFPPLMTFVSVVFTVSLSPYIILTSYMLRLATVAMRTTAAGPFSLR